MKSSVLESPAKTDELAELRAALKQHGEAQSAYDKFLPTLNTARGKTNSFLFAPRGTNDGLEDVLNRSLRYGHPRKEEMPAFNAAVAAENEAKATTEQLGTEIAKAKAAIEAALAAPLAELHNRITARRDAIIDRVTKTLLPFVNYASDAAEIARGLFAVKILDGDEYFLRTGPLPSRARKVLADFDKYNAPI